MWGRCPARGTYAVAPGAGAWARAASHAHALSRPGPSPHTASPPASSTGWSGAISSRHSIPPSMLDIECPRINVQGYLPRASRFPGSLRRPGHRRIPLWSFLPPMHESRSDRRESGRPSRRRIRRRTPGCVPCSPGSDRASRIAAAIRSHHRMVTPTFRNSCTIPQKSLRASYTSRLHIVTWRNSETDRRRSGDTERCLISDSSITSTTQTDQMSSYRAPPSIRLINATPSSQF